MTTRRTFCRSGFLSILATASLPWSSLNAAALSRAKRPMPLPKLNYRTFSSQQGTVFTVRSEDGRALALTLAQATLGKRRKNQPQGGVTYESFSLLFAGPTDVVLEQGIYALEHDRIGRFEVFVVPVLSSDPSVRHYETIFNRPVVKRPA